MYDIRQFKPALYALLLIGTSGFALAANWPGLWVLSTGGILLNAWLVRTGRFTPMPRLLASIVTVIAFVYIADLVINSGAASILYIGQFLVLLQLVKLYEQRANRDYAQLIVLSLLLMVAAAINTASLVFGLLFIGYLFLSLYVCLLFHLKVESEDARKAITLPNIEPNPNTLRQDQRFLASSMRRLTGLIATVAVVMAVAVFLFFPRGTGANLLGPQFQPARAMTGFSESVGFQEVARITQSNEPVASLQVWHNGQFIAGTETIYLRGLTLNRYTGPGSPGFPGGAGRFPRPPHQWIRWLPMNLDVVIERDGDEGRLADEAGTGDIWRQNIVLQPTGNSVLFAMEGAFKIRSTHHIAVAGSRYDGYIQLKDAAMPLEYEVFSNGRMPYRPVSADTEIRPMRSRGLGTMPTARIESVIEPQIGEYVRRPDVSGRGEGNLPLVELREQFLARAGWREGMNEDDVFAPWTPYDQKIAQNIEHHLRTAFTYTLDLTDARRIEGQDPMVAFLYDFKRGHCEYFAGAMTLMLQGLDIPARMVVGFRCDDYNSVGEYYRVQQNQAHAWVEERGGSEKDQVWVRFDPTSGREDPRQRSVSLWSRVRNVFDYLEHTWATSVIAYDRGSRDNLVRTLEDRLTNVAISGATHMIELPDFLKNENREISIGVLTVLTTLAVIGFIVAVAWFAWERWRMWRRAKRIGLKSLPSEQRLRLARQLGFYDDLLMLLERRGIVRPSHLTPLEFTDSLSYLPADAYHAIRRLTEVFYRIRYGRQQISSGRRNKLDGMIVEVAKVLGPTSPRA